MTPEHDDRHHESVGAYLLGALPELEHQAFERHVMGCADCRSEIERLRLAVDALPRSVTPLSAPPGLRRTLMAEVAGDLARAENGATESSQGASGARAGLASRLRRWVTPAFRRARPVTAWASAAFLLAAGIFVGYGATGLLDSDTGTDRTYAAAFDRSRLVDGSGSLTVPEDSDRAVLSVHGMPALPSRQKDEIYQLWVVQGNEVIPSSLLTVGRDGNGSAAVPAGVEDADAVWVTREQIGGARAPTENPVMRIALN